MFIIRGTLKQNLPAGLHEKVQKMTQPIPLFRQKDDGTWVSTKTCKPVDIVKMSLSEFLAIPEKEQK